MKLNNDTIAMFQSFANINRSAYFREGKIQRSWNEERTVISKIEIENEFPQDFAIYDLSKFLNAISVIENPEFTFHENYVIIHNDRQKMRYVFADKEVVDVPNDKDLVLKDPITSFDLSEKGSAFRIRSYNTYKFGNGWSTELNGFYQPLYNFGITSFEPRWKIDFGIQKTIASFP